MFQSWQDLTFLHWPVPHDTLRVLVPPELELETFDGEAWLGLTPFRVEGLRPRWLPPAPVSSRFLEANLRTYVRHRGRSGVFFFSLETTSLLAVAAARAFYRLPYRLAFMSMSCRNGWYRYRSWRLGDRRAQLSLRCRATGEATPASPGSLEAFLVERYALYSVVGGRVMRGDIHHAPWPLQAAEVDITYNGLPAAHGIALNGAAPLAHFAARQDTLIWSLTRDSLIVR